MENHNFILNIFIFLATVAVVVPIAGKFKLGSVLGYLAAGILIGPFGLGFIQSSEEIGHFGEFGIIMMLFLVGLELEPAILWRLRKNILGLGGFQVALTSTVLTAIGLSLGISWQTSLMGGLALSLSSTALVLQMMEEKGLLKTAAGKSSFAVLLFQDIAVIPILIALPFLAGTSSAASQPHQSLLTGFPGWSIAFIIAGVIIFIILAGHFLSRAVFRFIAKTNLREIFTTASLAIIVGITLLMQSVGVSPALGAFVAGVVLANSEYRHTLHADIQPFKAILLGLFFISIGMGMNFDLILAQPGSFLGAVVCLMALKALILYALGSFFGLRGAQNTLFALALAQGGEFAFVLFQYGTHLGLFAHDQTAFLSLVVVLSMAATPFLMMMNEHYVVPRFMSRLPKQPFDTIDEKNNPVLIAGYGRSGQIIGRFLAAQGIKITILEKDPNQIDLLRKFGTRAYFGDATRMELLESAGATKAKIFVVALGNPDKSLEIVKLVRAHFPDLKIYARARNRRHAYELHKAGAQFFRREVFDSSVIMAKEVMKALGVSLEDAEKKAELFMEHDEKTLRKSFEFFERESELINFTQQATGELEQILREDIQPERGPLESIK